MKILKRLSLMSTIDQRLTSPKPNSPWLQRYLFNQHQQTTLTVQQQLVKYGYTSKPRYNGIRLVIGSVAVVGGLVVHLYLTAIYKNQVDVRNKYRVQELERSSILLRLRRVVFKFAELMESQLFSTEIIMRNRSKQLTNMSEAIVRTEQYRNYMAKKDRKFQFMDIGILQKYPFPDMKDQQ